MRTAPPREHMPKNVSRLFKALTTLYSPDFSSKLLGSLRGWPPHYGPPQTAQSEVIASVLFFVLGFGFWLTLWGKDFLQLVSSEPGQTETAVQGACSRETPFSEQGVWKELCLRRWPPACLASSRGLWAVGSRGCHGAREWAGDRASGNATRLALSTDTRPYFLNKYSPGPDTALPVRQGLHNRFHGFVEVGSVFTVPDGGGHAGKLTQDLGTGGGKATCVLTLADRVCSQ